MKPTIVSRLFLALIRFYKMALSPFLKPSCRFLPTCSEYAALAFQKHPWPKALWLVLKRLSRCHPLGGSGIDRVP